MTARPDTAGTANSWIENLGDTQNRPGLCKATPKQDLANRRGFTVLIRLAARWWRPARSDATHRTPKSRRS